MAKLFNTHDIESISWSGSLLSLKVDGKSYTVDVQDYSYRLGVATQEQREEMSLMWGGKGLYWSQLDEGLFVDVLIGKARLLPHESKQAWDEHLAADPLAH